MASEAAPVDPVDPVEPGEAALAIKLAKRRKYARAMNIGVAALAFVVLTVAFVLKPDARGHGTHESLGLPPCGLLQMTGIPCPFCGMTTSYTHMAHGQVVQGFKTQPMGAVLFLMTVGAVFFFSRRAFVANPEPPDELIGKIPIWAWLAFAGALLAAWAYKTVIILTT